MRGLANTQESATEAKVPLDPRQSAPCSAVTESLRVLITDDNTTNRKLLRAVLESENHVVFESDNGISALQILDQTQVDAVISDILMPEMDGYRLCYEIRKNSKFRTLPFIVYTASYTSPSDEKVALQFGVDKFLRKPASSDEIVKSLYEVLASVKIRARDELQIPEEAEAMRGYNQVLVRKLEETIVDLSAANQTLAERSALAEFVAAVSTAISEANGLREMLRHCCDAMVRHLDAAFSRIWTLNEKENVLELQASSGMYTHIDGGHSRIPVGQFKIGLIASERVPHLTNAVVGDPRVHDQEWAKREGMVAFAGYPMLIADHLVGVMAVFSRKPLSQNTLDAMGSVAQNIAVGVQRQLAEGDLRRSEERFRELAENINEIFFVADPSGGTVHYASPAYEGITGQKRDVLYQNPHAWLEIIHPDDRPLVEQAFGDNTESLDQEYRIVRSNGDVRWLRSRAFPVKGESGAVIRVVGIAADITKRKLAEERLNQNLNRMRALYDINLAITSTLDLPTILKVLLAKTENLFPYPTVTTVRLLNRTTGELEALACHNIDAGDWKNSFADQRGGRAYQVLNSKVPLLVRNVLTHSDTASPTLFQKYGLVSYIGLPLIAKDAALGVLNFYTKQDHVFSAEEIEFLMTLASQAAIAIHNAQLHEQTQRNLERIKALHEIDLAITSTLDLQYRLDVLLEKIDIFLPFPAATTIRLFNVATQKFENTACRNIDEQEWKLGTGRGTGQLSREFLKTKGPVIVPNIQTDMERKNTEFFRKHGFVSYIGVPLIAKGDVVGVLGFHTREAHEFTQQEIGFLTTLAGQAAIAIDNAQLYEQTQRRRREAEELARVARSLTEILDPTVVGERIVTSVGKLFGVQGSTLRFRHADGSFRHLASSGEAFSQTSVGDAVSSDVGLTRWAIAEGKPIWSRDTLNDPQIFLTDEMRDYQIRSGNRSMIVMPLRAHEKLIGTLTLSDRTGRIYSDNEVELLQTFGDQAALALENARLFEQTERQLERIEALREIEKSITSTLDLITVLNVLMEKIDLFFAYPVVATVRLFDKDSGLLEPAAARNIEIGKWITAMRGVQDNANSYGRAVIEKESPLVIPNLQTDPRTQNPQFYCEHGLISYAGVPLIAKDEVLGVLGIYTKEEHSFSDEEIGLLMILAGQAAIAIHNARLFEKIELSKRELETTVRFLDKSLNQLAGLYTAMTPVALSESLGEMFNGIIERLIDATGADAALIRIWDKDSDNYPVIGQVGYSEEFVELGRPAQSEGAVGWVIKNGEPIIASDIVSDSRLKRKAQLEMGLQSCAILPLSVHSEVSGVIQISSRTVGFFDEEQKDHLLAVARQMSIALENHELFYSLKASRDELERANRVKDEFLSVMSHELRTPLSVVLGYSRMFQEQQLGPLTNDQQQAMKVVLRNSQELLEMIESIMDATKIEAGSMTAEMDPVSPLQLLGEIKRAYDFPMAKNIRLEWEFPESLSLLRSDSRKLRQILTNLINNAIKFTEEGRIVIAAEEKHQTGENYANRWIEFRVSDTGIGIPPEECDKIFDRFHQVDSSKTRSFEGVGLGLYIVKSFTGMLGGQVSVCSELGKGSTFTVSLPVEIAP
jgi:PAS domain S-box-containing protein